MQIQVVNCTKTSLVLPQTQQVTAVGDRVKPTSTLMPTQTQTTTPPLTPQTTTTKTWTSQYRGEQLPQAFALLYKPNKLVTVLDCVSIEI